MKQAMWVLVALLTAGAAVAKTPKPLVTIELERRPTPWPSATELALPEDVSAAVAELAQEEAKLANVQAMVAGSAQQEAGESPTVLLEKAQAAARAKRNAALAKLRPAAKTAAQWLVLADIEADFAQDAYDLAMEAGAKSPKLDLKAVEAACVKGMAQSPTPEQARWFEYLWALALEARGQAADAAQHLRSVAQAADEPWKSEALFRAGALALPKDPAAALGDWAQVSAPPFVTYAGYRQVTELVKSGKCAQANDALGKLKAAPPMTGTSFVEVATQAAAACKAKP